MSHALKIAVTGAAGALGAQVVRLAVEAGHEVIAIDKHSANLTEHEAQKVEHRRGDLTSRKFCHEAVQGAQILIHTAARNDPSLSYDKLATINFDAVRWLYDACQAQGVTRFVQVSAASLYVPGRSILTEESEIEPDSAYTHTKADAERFLRSRSVGTPSWTILRPSLMYGPGVRSFGASLLTLPPMLRLLFPYVPGLTGGYRNNWVHVEDLARAALLVAQAPEAERQTYNVADETILSQGEILDAMMQAYGLAVGPTVPMSTNVLANIAPLIDSALVFRAITRLVDPLWNSVVTRHKLENALSPSLHPSGVAYLLGDRMISSDKLRALGWAPQWPDLRTGMADTVRWYQQKGWLPNYQALPGDGEFDEGIGFGLHESLEGRATWAPGVKAEDNFCMLDMDITFPSLRRLPVDQSALLEGTISLDHIAEKAALHGTLSIHKMERRMVYEFGFDGDDETSYRFRGEKNLTILGNIRDFARLPGVIINSRGEEIAQLDLAMDLRPGLGQMIRSLKLV